MGEHLGNIYQSNTSVDYPNWERKTDTKESHGKKIDPVTPKKSKERNNLRGMQLQILVNEH